jgi:GTPase SAR1 family protein
MAKLDFITNDFIKHIANSGSLGTSQIEVMLLQRLQAGLSSITVEVNVCLLPGQTEAPFMAWLEANDYLRIPVSDRSYFMRVDKTNRCFEAMIDYTLSERSISASLFGDSVELARIQAFLLGQYETSGARVTTAVQVDQYQNVEYSSTRLVRSQTKQALQCFYPWLDVPLEEYYHAFMAAAESVLVMFGPPGNGKSTFLRSLILSGDYPTVVVYSSKVIESPSLLSNFYSSNNKILAYEDVDFYMEKRSEGNQQMSPMLNSSEGIILHPGKKLVFSNNLASVDKIDPALLRYGRCFDILEFRNLTANEAHVVAEQTHLNKRDFSSKDSWTLAEVLAVDTPGQQTVNRFAKKVGF